jgi:uncharacterized membrane protein
VGDFFVLIVFALLLTPVGVLILFVNQSQLRGRIVVLEREIRDLHVLLRSAGGVPPLPDRFPEPAGPEPEPEAYREPLEEERPLEPAAAEPFAPDVPWRFLDDGDDAEDQQPEGEAFGAVFERFVAGRLLIWIGGAALAGAAILLIKYSIEIGLLTPKARMIGAAVFGFALLAAGEGAPRIRHLSDDRRVAQALIGAGIVTLYATPYGSHVLYGLIGSRTAAFAMFGVSALALFLSLRHGPATAIMGLVGGFLMPALVGDPSASAVPLLVYLTLLSGAVFGIAWRRGWTWLAAASVVLSFLWSFYVLGGPPDDAAAAGFFVIALSVVAAIVRPGRGPELGYVQPLVIGLVELAVLVGRADLGFAAWAMFGALAAVSVALSLLRAEHRFAPPAALALVLVCIAARTPDQDPYVPWAAAAATLLFAGASIPLASHGDRLLRTLTGAGALFGPLFVLRVLWPELLLPAGWGGIALALGLAALLLAWLQRGEAGKEPALDPPLFLAAATAAALLDLAAYDLLPPMLVAAGWSATALVLALAGRRIRDEAFTVVTLVAAACAGLCAAGDVSALWATLAASITGVRAYAGALPPPRTALLSLDLPALLIAATALALPPWPRLRRGLLGLAALFALAALYILAKQVFAIEDREAFVVSGFAERTAITQSLFALGWLLAGRRLRLRRVEPDQLAWLGSAITLLAALRLIWFDMLLHNPLLDEQAVGGLPVLNLLVPAYLLSAFWLYHARRRADAETRSGFWLIACLAALVLGVMLIVRQGFQGPILADLGSWPRAEMYMYSLAGLLLSAALIVGGIRLPDKAVRLAGLALLTATIVKVFASDAAALEGILRILSFFGLGVGLIGVALLYGPVLRAEAGRKKMVGATGFEPATPTPPV